MCLSVSVCVCIMCFRVQATVKLASQIVWDQVEQFNLYEVLVAYKSVLSNLKIEILEETEWSQLSNNYHVQKP